jgi:hypothetical protein
MMLTLYCTPDDAHVLPQSSKRATLSAEHPGRAVQEG